MDLREARRIWRTAKEVVGQKPGQDTHAIFRRIVRKRAAIQADTYETDAKHDVAFDVMMALEEKKVLEWRLSLCHKIGGNGYRDLVKDILIYSLWYAIDEENVTTEFKCSAGKADIALPIRLETEYPLWQSWCQRYRARGLLVEVKKLRGGATFEDVGQTEHYLGTGGVGSLAMLVSYGGFKDSALTELRQIAAAGERLILPLDQQDLATLLRLNKHEPCQSMEFLRKLETNLVFAA